MSYRLENIYHNFEQRETRSANDCIMICQSNHILLVYISCSKCELVKKKQLLLPRNPVLKLFLKDFENIEQFHQTGETINDCPTDGMFWYV